MALRFKWTFAKSAKMITTLGSLATGFPPFLKFTKYNLPCNIYYLKEHFALFRKRWETIRQRLILDAHSGGLCESPFKT